MAIQKLSPFRLWVLQNFPFIAEDFDALTNYELMCKIVEYLNNVIDITNEQTKAINELTTWFDNLDVQEEINNKLDEMAESGELTDIIAQYLDLAGLLCFNTKSDLKNAENLSNGSFTKTFGTITYNDGKGEFYKIRTLINTDVIDDDNLLSLTNYPTLVAEKIPNATITSILDRLDNLENKNYRKMILIGDSYCEQNSDSDITKFYWETLRDNLNLTQNVNFYSNYQSGAGFGNQAYLTKLQELNSTITDKNSITDILVSGGWNDSDTSQSYGTEEAFNAGILAFNNYVKTNYPNAKITIAHISCGDPYITHTNAIFEQMPTSIRRYQDACNKYGWRYLVGAENILHYYNQDFWQSDGNHPSQQGQTLLGNELTRAFITGSTNIFRLHSGSLTGSGKSEFINYGTLYGLNNNDTSEIFTPKSNIGIYVKAAGDTQNINCDGAHEYEIGTIYSLEIYGHSPYLLTSVPCYFTGTFNGTNSTYMGYTDIFIYSSKLYIRPTLFINGNRAENFDFNYIWLPNFKIEAPTRYC